MDKGLQLITTIKAKMKNKLMLIADRILLRKRYIIEIINDQLKIYLKLNIQDTEVFKIV